MQGSLSSKPTEERNNDRKPNPTGRKPSKPKANRQANPGEETVKRTQANRVPTRQLNRRARTTIQAKAAHATESGPQPLGNEAKQITGKNASQKTGKTTRATEAHQAVEQTRAHDEAGQVLQEAVLLASQRCTKRIQK